MKPKMSKTVMIEMMLFIGTLTIVFATGLYFMYLINTCAILCF